MLEVRDILTGVTNHKALGNVQLGLRWVAAFKKDIQVEIGVDHRVSGNIDTACLKAARVVKRREISRIKLAPLLYQHLDNTRLRECDIIEVPQTTAIVPLLLFNRAQRASHLNAAILELLIGVKIQLVLVAVIGQLVIHAVMQIG